MGGRNECAGELIPVEPGMKGVCKVQAKLQHSILEDTLALANETILQEQLPRSCNPRALGGCEGTPKVQPHWKLPENSVINE